MALHTYTPQPMSLPSMNFLHLTVSEIQPGQTIYRRPPAHPDTMGENTTPTALKGCGVKMVRIHPLIREIFKGDSNAAATVMAKLDKKTNKRPFSRDA